MRMAEDVGAQSFDVAQPFNRCLMESSSSQRLHSASRLAISRSLLDQDQLGLTNIYSSV